MTTKILTIILSVLLLTTVIELIRREKLSFKFAAGWLLVALLALFFAFFDKVLFNIAFTLGFEIPSNFIFFTCLFCITFLSLLLTIFLCQQSKRNDLIAQKLSLLENKIEVMSNSPELKDAVK